MKRYLSSLALPLLSIAACLDMSDQDSTEDTLSENGQAGVAVFAGSSQPGALASGRICETYGGERCIGAPTIAFEDPVEETAGGRILQPKEVASGIKLQFSADTTRCVAVTNNDTLVEVRSCDAVDGARMPAAVWAVLLGPDGSSCMFLNQHVTRFLSGPNNGGQFQLQPKGASGWLQQFRAPNLGCPGPFQN